MLNKRQIMLLFDYTKMFRYYAEKILAEAQNNPKLSPELYSTITTEQRRRIKELTRLERALGAEIATFSEEGSDIDCQDVTSKQSFYQPTTTKAKRKKPHTVTKTKLMDGTDAKPQNAKGRKKAKQRKSPDTKES